MTSRRPLVIASGLAQELPAGDNIADPVLAALAQIFGRDGATVMQVEANTKAGRIVFYPADAGAVQEQCFDLSHHSVGWSSNFSATTVFSASDIGFLGWFNPGYSVIRKIWVSVGTSAVSGARGPGLGRAFVREMKPLLSGTGVNNFLVPPILNNVVLNNNANSIANFSSLRQRQPSPQMAVCSPIPGSTAAGALTTGGTLGAILAEVDFGVKSAVGTDLPPTMLHDAAIILEPGQGLAITLQMPAAVTSQTVNFAVNVVWDEWYPMPQAFII
jgi:hypothetical protein